MTSTAFPPESLSTFVEQLSSRYRIERELGRGGMATVYYARDLAQDREVAIKVLLPELAASIGADRFLREIEVGRVLQHPHIVGVLDSGEADGRLYYVMPYIDGASLRERLDAHKQLGIDESIEIVRQMADGLDFAHARGVIHRDIKPENILLSGGRAMLADFGIARAVSVAGGEKLTQTGMAVGTPTYMSPEQAMGSKDVTAESDIYSLACVLYEMLAGQPPFTGPTAMALLARHSLDNVPSLKIVRGTVPDAVEDAIAKAMAKVPADRFHTAGAFVQALGDHEGAARKRAASLQASAHRTAAGPAFLGKVGGRRTMAIGAVALLVGGGVAAWQLAGSGGSATPSGPRPNQIAVLYFDDASPGRELAHLSDGLTEALIQQLGDVDSLHVISRNGVLPFKGKRIPPDSLSGLLGVGTIVTGTLRSAGDKLRVAVEIIDARTGEARKTATIERPKTESFELQDDLAMAVGDILRQSVGDFVQLQRRGGARNAEAYDAYQRARQLITDAEQLLASGDAQAASAQLARADSAFAGVESRDDRWVAPIVQRGWLAYRQSRLLNVFDRPVYSRWITDGLVHANRALALAPQDADALDLRGTLRYWQWLLNIVPDATDAATLFRDAEADLEAAVKINPQQASAWNSLSHLRANKSQTAQGKLAALKAYEADPYLSDINRTIWRLVTFSNDLGDENEARKWCDLGGRRFPEDFRFTECRLWLLTLKTPRRPTADSIWASYDAFVKASPANLKEYHRLKGGMLASIALLRAGLPDSARAVAVRSRGGTEIDPTLSLARMEAIVRAQLGDKDEAFRLLERFFAVNPQQRTGSDKDDTWWLEDIKDDPRWEALTKG